jgi:hypothetical protein
VVNTNGKTCAYHKVQAADAGLQCQAQIYRKSCAALKILKGQMASWNVSRIFRQQIYRQQVHFWTQKLKVENTSILLGSGFWMSLVTLQMRT